LAVQGKASAVMPDGKKVIGWHNGLGKGIMVELNANGEEIEPFD
jgi:hypothetical protein